MLFLNTFFGSFIWTWTWTMKSFLKHHDYAGDICLLSHWIMDGQMSVDLEREANRLN